MCKKTGQVKDLDKYKRVLTLFKILAFFFVACSFAFPYILTEHYSGVVFDAESGQIGDTIGGIMNPFVGLASVAMMFLAFYIQYIANKMMQDQFKKNQFENRFFEMLKTHKENSNMIITTHYENEEKMELENIIAITPYESKEEMKLRKETDYKQRLGRRKKGFEHLVEKINNEYERQKIKNKDIDAFERVYRSVWEDSFGHYFRHLFLMVKFVVSKPDDFLTYEEKRDYLRILRASLSVSEQIFLYYNWLSGYGEKWEGKEIDNNNDNHFFTTYRMIHNVNPESIHEDFKINEMPPFKELLEQENDRGEEDKRTGKEREDDDLFELV